MIENLSVCITFHLVQDRLNFLKKTASELASFAKKIEINLFTNVNDARYIEMIREALSDVIDFTQIHTPNYLGHPYLLTWSHFSLFKRLAANDSSISHFMYLEDDIYLNKKNIDYWLQARKELKKYGLIPSFARYEINSADGHKYSTDQVKSLVIDKLPRIRIPDTGSLFINLPNPYQGMYLMDREMMLEFFSSKAAIPEYSHWGIREKATAGLTFVNVPTGCYSRNFLLFDTENNRIIISH